MYRDLFVDQDSERTEHLFDQLSDGSGSIDFLGWSQGVRLQVCRAPEPIPEQHGHANLLCALVH